MVVGSGAKVGVPRTLFYHSYFPAWHAFLSGLGLDVVVSPPTNQDIVDLGIELAVTDACVPIKVMHGHVSWLVSHGVDYLFLPRIISTNGQAVYCPKFLGLPDMIASSLTNLPHVLSPRYDRRAGSRELSRLAAEVGAAVGASPAEVTVAVAAARTAHAAYSAALGAGVPLEAALDTVVSGASDGASRPDRGSPGRQAAASRQPLRLAVVGYPYLVHDRHLSLDLLGRLSAMGVTAVTAQEVSPAVWRHYQSQLPKDLFWTYSQEAVLAGYHFLADRAAADGSIHLTAFGCGPDSVAAKLLSMQAEDLGGVPFMSLMIDEHTGEAGFATRLEAFVDMTRRRIAQDGPAEDPLPAPAQAQVQAQAQALPQAVRSGASTGATGAVRAARRLVRRTRRVTFPYLGTLPEVFREVLVEMGNEVVMPARPSTGTLTLGTKHSPEFACLPFKILLGTYLEAIERGADTIVSSGGIGPCRAGLYTMVQERILRALGHDADIITLEPPRLDIPGIFYKIAALNPRRLPFWRIASLVRRAWHKIQVLDKLEALSHVVRPRELLRGATTKAWQAARGAVYAAKARADIAAAGEGGRQLLLEVPQREGVQPLRVGIVGEIYVLVEPAANFELEEALGEMGVEPVRELYMSGWTRESNVWGRPDERLAEHAADAARPYLSEMIGGHGQESVGNAVLFARAGLDGVIQLAPFTCIPEIVAKSALERACPELQIPFLSISLDEQTGRAGLSTRIEAFVDLMARSKGHRLGTVRVAGIAAGGC